MQSHQLTESMKNLTCKVVDMLNHQHAKSSTSEIVDI